MYIHIYIYIYNIYIYLWYYWFPIRSLCGGAPTLRMPGRRGAPASGVEPKLLRLAGKWHTIPPNDPLWGTIGNVYRALISGCPFLALGARCVLDY
jgi:hypothetical protein